MTGAYVVLALPLLLIAAPFVLTGYTVSERLRRCPLCDQRGFLSLSIALVVVRWVHKVRPETRCFSGG